MHKTTELFCLIDDFCQQFEPLLEQRMLDDSSGKQRRNRPSLMSLSEMTTIVVLFHTMRGRQFKAFYRGIVCRFMTAEFPRRLSYTRFVALMPRCAAVLAALFGTLKGACTGISIADSTPLAVCHNLAHPTPQRFQSYCPTRQIIHRLVLRLQAARGYQPSGRVAGHQARLRETWMTVRACWPSPQACSASCTPTRATLAKSLRAR